ncbi:MAG: hypothetical protein GYB55_12445 [Cytophagales bacterium]|uniref:hypothetical protein n=1 Tax=Cyclobacterium marinum TaxID=104 RepID=UPI0030DBDC4B|nr:hypothetical protein [Cytophagales bacterium]|tara:strand:+ start:293 stop:469 length:177 start_codon:yes stop_codon:yes gene_type:complete
MLIFFVPFSGKMLNHRIIKPRFLRPDPIGRGEAYAVFTGGVTIARKGLFGGFGLAPLW